MKRLYNVLFLMLFFSGELLAQPLQEASSAGNLENNLEKKLYYIFSNPEKARARRYLTLKTNAVAWAGTIMNVAADVQVGMCLSIELPVLWCPWYATDQHAVRNFTLQPELRWWPKRPGEGHFWGVHTQVSWFNVKWNDRRYQDTDRPLLGAGISYGYLLSFNAHWAGEFTLGAGYANLKYNTYYNIANGARIDTRTKDYWGITRVGVSLVYKFDFK